MRRVALEDHAFRACLVALDIQQEVQTLGVTVERRDGTESSDASD